MLSLDKVVSNHSRDDADKLVPSFLYHSASYRRWTCLTSSCYLCFPLTWQSFTQKIIKVFIRLFNRWDVLDLSNPKAL